jgi:hypothetical protein
MYSKLGTTVAILMGAFPFIALGYTIAGVSAIAIVVYAVVLVILLGGLLLAPRLNLAEASADTAGRSPRAPAPPIEWNWEGVNRQPGDEDD